MLLSRLLPARQGALTPTGRARLALHVAQPVLGEQAQFVVADQRVALDEDVRDRVQVVAETGQGCLAGDHSAAGVVFPIQHEHIQPGLGQVCAGGQAMMAAADDDDVVRHRYASAPRRSSRWPPSMSQTEPVTYPLSEPSRRVSTGRATSSAVSIPLIRLVPVAISSRPAVPSAALPPPGRLVVPTPPAFPRVPTKA